MASIVKKWRPLALVLLAITLISFGSVGLTNQASSAPNAPAITQFVFTSDPHYGITRPSFRGKTDVDATVVNAALVEVINSLPKESIPCGDGGVNACQPVGAIDFIIEAGDIANRSEALSTTPVIYIQSAATSWAQFEKDYIKNLNVKDKNGNKAPLFIVPGNHDVTNAIGFYKKMTPATDATTMAEIYNLMLGPATPLTKDTYNYDNNKIYYSRDVGGVHFQFVGIWPDSDARAWMAEDLNGVSPTTPVVVVAHDQPDPESKHFTNPNPPHNINSKDQFENLLVDLFADAATVSGADGKSVKSILEQQDLVAFLKDHKNIVAYFHGNENYNQYYTYSGPDGDISLNIFRVDSPMKGNFSGKDETKLGIHIVSIDPEAQNMTVRDYFWNTKTWGDANTVPLTLRTN